MSSTATRQPPAANAATTARPSPPVPPVISTVLSTRATVQEQEGLAPIPSGPGSTFRPMVVRELTDGQELDCILLVRARELRTKRDGSEYLRLTLGDRTGSVAAVVWDGVADLSAVCESGAVVRVQGRYAVHPRYGCQI